MRDLTWEIGVLLQRYANRANKLDKHNFDEKDRLKKLYAKAILLNVEHGYGLFYPIDDFTDAVSDGCYIDYDGIGYLLDVDGNRIGPSRCNVKFLEAAKSNGAVYVSWFNK